MNRYGIRNYASAHGLISVFYALGGAVAASSFGRAYDQTRFCAGILTVAAVILVVGAASFLALGKFRA
jgi:hypothetical protein